MTRKRLLLWGLSIALVAVVAVALGCAEAEARLHEARSLLALGDAEAAERLLRPLADSPLNGAQARAGLAIASALQGVGPGPSDDTTAEDASSYALVTLARGAFDRGEFQAVLALTDLASQLGLAELEVLRTAALIEEGRVDELPEGVAATQGELAARVEKYLASVDEHAHRTVLRDRSGRLLGYLGDDDEIELVSGIAAPSRDNR